jgi:hypothetical protein
VDHTLRATAVERDAEMSEVGVPSVVHPAVTNLSVQTAGLQGEEALFLL